MAKSTVPRFTISKAQKGEKPVALLSIPLTAVEKFGDAISEVLANAKAGGAKIKSLKASIKAF